MVILYYNKKTKTNENENGNIESYLKKVFKLLLFISLISSFKLKFKLKKEKKREKNFPKETIIKMDVDVPEINLYNNQTLKLLVPSKQCINLFPRTLYFTPKFRTKNIAGNIEINTINLNESNKRYFVTYYSEREEFEEYNHILTDYGLIRSHFINASNNIFLHLTNKGNNFKANKYKKKYSFFEVEENFSKDFIYKNYKLMKKNFTDEYNYMPETYGFPEDLKILVQKFYYYKLNLNNLWLDKPILDSNGNGISIFKKLRIVHNQRYLITKLITNIDLIDKKKYDLRIYVLITGLNPLRIYFNKEGLVRRATKIYNLTLESLNDKCIYLTNTDINMKNNNYTYPKNYNDKKANMWNLNTYKNYLKSKKVDYNAIKEKIKDIIIKSIISFKDNLLYKNERIHVKDRNIYTLLGYDILITDKYEPILLEINNNPSLKIRNIIDEQIKKNLFTDILNLVGIMPFSHDFNTSLFDKEYKFDNDSDELVNNAFCELSRPRGDLELIFPLKENIDKYRKFFIKNNEENIKFWEKINSS